MNEPEPYVLDDLGVQADGEPVAVEPAAQGSEQDAQAEAEQGNAEEGKPARSKPGSARYKEQRDLARQEAEYWKRAALEHQKQPAEVPAPEDPSRPRPESFDSHDAYVEAVAEYKARKLLAERDAQQQAERMRTTWQEKAAKAAEKHEDLYEVLESTPAPSPAVVQALHASEIGPELAYHIAVTPDLLDRLNRMSPAAVGLELGRLEAKLASPKTDPPKAQVSKAPKPPTPVTSSAPVKPGDDGRHVLY